MPTPKLLACLTARLLLSGACFLLAACGDNQEPPAPTTSAVSSALAASAATEAQPTAGAEVDTLLPPPTPGEETPLQAPLANAPPIAVFARTLSKSELAAMLHTTVEQLEYANANTGLEDPILAGTPVMVPTGYQVFEDETLADIAANTGIAEAELRKSNGLNDGSIPLAAGTVLNLPPPKIVQEEITLADLAAAIEVPPERLLEANPYLAQMDPIPAGTMIILPSGSHD